MVKLLSDYSGTQDGAELVSICIPCDKMVYCFIGGYCDYANTNYFMHSRKYIPKYKARYFQCRSASDTCKNYKDDTNLDKITEGE